MDPLKEMAIRYSAALAEAIRSLKVTKEGHLYAMVMGRMTLPVFTECINVLVETKLVSRGANHDLKWVGDDVLANHKEHQ